MSNHLANENSPYLLQHAENPVEWYPWCEEALARARNENKPIFLSIGYAACHWCHVMAHESFENEETAAMMNAAFINIKVDREERPDLDNIYMTATASMTGSGGWPMSVFLTPDLRPFYAGTYFPPVRRFNMPSFRDLLTGIAQGWLENPQEIYRIGAQVTKHIQQLSETKNSGTFPLTHALLITAADHLVQSYDWGFGGWGEAPKFPHPMSIEFLLSMATGQTAILLPEKSEKYLKTACHSLKAMARGGMYDVVGGGFARYSVDNIWKTPHFEKMLYDNAQLSLAYLHAYLITGEAQYRHTCEETLDFILREMTHPDGGFYSSLDADSEGHEGKFYTWDLAEIQSALPDDIDFFTAAYGLAPTSSQGENNSHGFEGKLILQRTLDDQTMATRLKLEPAQLRERISACHARLLQVRNKCIRPATDDKILTAWNALALTAFAEAGRYLGRPDYLAAAERNAHFILEHLAADGRLLRSWRHGTARHQAYLEDYASLIIGLLALYQSSSRFEWYLQALKIGDEMIKHFADPDGGFFDVSDDHERLLLRPKELQDNATPCGGSLASIALLLLAEFGDRPEWRSLAETTLTNVLDSAIRYPTSFSRWLCAADFALGPTQQVAIIGDPDVSATRTLQAVLWKNYQPHLVLAASDKHPNPGMPALLADRPMLDGLPTAYVCQGFVCRQPVNTPEALSEQLASHKPQK